MSENQTNANPRLVEQIVTPFIDSIVLGDNVATMKQLPDECIDLTVTSPPYDDLRTYGGHSWDFEGVAMELFRVTKKGGVVVWVVGDATVDGSETGTSFRQALRFMGIGFKLHDTMIYECNKPPLTHKRYEQAFEYMFVFVKAQIKTFNPKMKKNLYFGKNCLRNGEWASGKENSAMRQREGEKQIKEYGMQNNIWRYEIGGNKTTKDKIAFDHPAVFPEKLAEDHIASWSNKGDTVLDPFSGSGTTCKIAKELGRHFIGCEVNQTYVEISNQRLRQEVFVFEV